MYLYILFGILAISSIFEVFGKRDAILHKILQGIFCCSIFLLFFLSVLRWERGTDWNSYLNYFATEAQNLNLSHHFENGFIYLNHIVKSVANDYTVLLMVEGLILYSCLCKSIRSIAIYPIFSLFCYFAIMKGGIFFVRQTVAVSLLLLSVKYILNRDLLKFVFVVILAASLHRSSWLFLPCYWLYSLRLNLKEYGFILCISIVIACYLLTKMNGITIGIGNPYIDAKINGYLASGMENEMYGVNMSKETMLIRGIGKRFLFLILITSFLWKNILLSKRSRGIFNIYFCGACLYIILAPISIDFARAVLPFDLMDIFLLPLIVASQKILSNRVILFCFILLISLNRLHSSINLRPELFIPYKSVFNKELKVGS